ncbi:MULTISPECIES: phosphoribosyltransferase [Sphingobium]|jgi:hypoxanthine phosphoribosyltransferase|uniref:Phosphoribosyltransferase domain-containing protein n=1 Tax=Sphingobium fuliginis (strain ATCC 27551) TaxID=336203 RepID=A0A292ZI66_SPHSA|nr:MULTISPECIES: phosphoribosyltransferase family protein [Sphingobium]QOT73038.1 phosphoribosyltransferase domain-containing protein [Sphingobium fuliginis]GAY22584.1 xanthine-guanine phosphoribosyltransferase [Sphingobium fuliginis]
MGQPILTPVTMDAFLAQIDALARALAASQWRPDYLVGIGRGGLVPATYLSHATGLAMLSVDLSAKLPDFGEALLAGLAQRAATGETLLFVDDINDSGRTINAVRNALAPAPAAGVRFAVLIDNIRSAATVDYRAETIDRDATKDWFVFPWEAVASRDSILADWGEVPERTA